jgi:oxygen-dependent protoporphyrinogen oxidase
MPSRVVVVGGGLSGLAAACRIRDAVPGCSVTVLEEQLHAGGNVRTIRRDGFVVEAGPNGFLDNNPATVDLCRDVGLGDRLIPASDGSRKNRFLYLNDRLVNLPASPFGILTTPVLSVRGRLSLLAEPVRRRPRSAPADESVAAFARRRFGREAADTFVDALVTGIQGGDPEQLSLSAAFPRLAAFEAEAGSVLRGFLRAKKSKSGPTRMWSFRDGLQTLTDALAERLGQSIVTSAGVRRIERTDSGWHVRGEGKDVWEADAVVLTAPAYRQAELLEPVDAALAAAVAAIPYNRIAVVALGYRETDAPHRPDGFGYIAPQRTRRDVLGVQWCSQIFPGRAPPGYVLWRALCGGVHRGDVCDRNDDDLARVVHTEMRHAMGVTGEPVFREIVRWPRAIPQYVVGHPDRLARIDTRAANLPGLFLGGNAYRGIALNDCSKQGAEIASRVAAYLRTTREGSLT